jgi:predicted NAD/FAD-binding protein
VIGGSSDYIQKMIHSWNRVDLKTEATISGISRTENGATVHYHNDGNEQFDQVILATHADQALELLYDPMEHERQSLECWKYTNSKTVLHTDRSVMPPLHSVWSSWNFKRIEGNTTTLTYHMNRLMGLDTQQQYFVSLNLDKKPKGIIREFNYKHPMFTREALKSRERLNDLNGHRRTWFAGSYFGNGFHEDAVRSAVNIAEAFGINL